MRRLFLLISTLCSLCGQTMAEPAPATVFAAASLQGVLDAVAENSAVPLRLSFGGSGAMARQVAAGAPADLVILANTAWMDRLVEQGRVAPGTAQSVAGNQLVVIGPAGAPPLGAAAELPDRLGNGRLAMGHRDAVPAGIYARAWLTHAGLWAQVEGKLAETENVRAALALVSRQQTPLGVVYATDAQADPGVSVLLPVPPESHAPIAYPAAALSPAGAAVLEHLLSAEAQAVFAAHGFARARP